MHGLQVLHLFMETLPNGRISISLALPNLYMNRGSVSPQFEAVMLKALKKDPKERFPPMQSFALALEQAHHRDGEIRSSGTVKNVLPFSEMGGSMSQQASALLGVL